MTSQALKFLNMKYIVTFLGLLSLFCGCETNKDCDFPGQYQFELPITLSPAKDKFKVGDTIFINSTFPDEVYERQTERRYHLEDFRFYPGMGVVEISGDTSNEAALQIFDVLIDSETDFDLINYSNGVVAYIGEYSYSGNEYDLSFQLVPKEAGLFYFSLASAIYFYEDNQSFAGKCKEKGIDAIGYVNNGNGADNNIHLLSDSPDSHYNEWMLAKPEDRFHHFGGYCFYVEE